MQLSPRQISLIKGGLFLVCLIPLGRLVYGLRAHTLGANPIEFIIRDLGTWALNFLLITLCITPLRSWTGAGWLLRLRRMLGLFAFFYALLHFNIYLGLDQSYEWSEIGKDILKRPFITVGMLAFLLLLPLAITSNNRMIRRLGAQRWQKLHRLIYPIAMLAVLHYFWLVKKDLTQPLIYAGLLAALLGWRLWRKFYSR